MNKKTLSEKYEIKREIGRGGMGVIYEALHKTLNRKVAIKVLHAQYAGDSAFLKRFQREARAMARLDHVNIIRVFDVGKDEDLHYIVMEYFSGKDLKQIIVERETLSQQETLSIALQITKALSYAHAHGIIHRDIKPGNIMLNPAGLVKIADFGIAAATDEASVTLTGHVIGTPEYMSVEQARGEALDPRSDLYSLGMIIYEMLTGQTSFSGISKMAILGKLVYEKTEYDLPFKTHILSSIQNLVRSLLKKNKEERISDTATLVNLLNQASSELKTNISQAETLDETRLASIPLTEGVSPQKTNAISEKKEEKEEASLETIIFHKTPPSFSPNLSPSANPEMLPSKPTTRPSQQKMPSGPKRRRLILVVAGLSLLFIGFAYYLSVMNEEPPAPAIPTVLHEIKTIQKSIRDMQNKLSLSHKEADGNEASRWAKKTYGEAFDLESRGAKQLDEADAFIKKEQFQEANMRLHNALSFFSKAHAGFIEAKTRAQNKIIASERLKEKQEKTEKLQARAETERLKRERSKVEANRQKKAALLRVEQGKLKQAEAKAKTETEKREQERAEAERQQQAIHAEQEKLKQEKAAAEKEALAQRKKAAQPATAVDIKYLENRLKQLKAAYEKKDLSALKSMSQVTAKRAQFLKQIFDNYKTVQVDITNLSARAYEAKATLSILELGSFDGNRVFPSSRWKDMKLVFVKEGEVWGKAKW